MAVLRVHTPILRYYHAFDSMEKLLMYCMQNDFRLMIVPESIKGIRNLEEGWKDKLFMHPDGEGYRAFVVTSQSGDDLPFLSFPKV